MIKFINISKQKPYQLFKKYYDQALKNKQKIIEGIAISSFNKDLDQVNSRYVNLKYIKYDEWIFFSNYNSPKAKSFLTHQQISGLIHWPEINFQLRILAKIEKTNDKFSDAHFSERSKEKNAIAVSSYQSEAISSYEDVVLNYETELIKNKKKLGTRPSYWGGFSLYPYYFEFWTGNDSRINKRIEFVKKNNIWTERFLQP